MRQRLKRLYSLKAIPSWVVILWKIAETGDTMDSIVSWLSPAWQFLASPTGTTVLLIIGFGILIYLVAKPEKQQDKTASELPSRGIKEIPSFPEKELSCDLKRIAKAMRGRATRWDFSGIYNRESYFEIFVELTNTTIFTFSLKSLSGFMKIARQPCVNQPQVSTKFNMRRDEPTTIRVRQPIASKTVTIIQDAGNNNQEIEFDLGEVKFGIENTTRGYEKCLPYLTGGKYNIVPKDGLRDIYTIQQYLEDK